jgi:hypothetical protein
LRSRGGGGGAKGFAAAPRLWHVGAMLGGIDPHCLCCRWADLYVQLSNRISFEAKLIEQLEMEQAACTKGIMTMELEKDAE